MKFRPLHDRVLIRRVEEERRPRAASSSPTRPRKSRWRARWSRSGPGARGEDGKIQPLDVKAGDRVLFGKWSGTEVKLDGEDLIIMKESDIMGIIDQSGCPQGRLREEAKQWLPRKSDFTATRASGCCAASTFSPTPSR